MVSDVRAKAMEPMGIRKREKKEDEGRSRAGKFMKMNRRRSQFSKERSLIRNSTKGARTVK
jgi:hypothetical protein